MKCMTVCTVSVTQHPAVATVIMTCMAVILMQQLILLDREAGSDAAVPKTADMSYLKSGGTITSYAYQISL